jgi:hypothetical protein
MNVMLPPLEAIKTPYTVQIGTDFTKNTKKDISGAVSLFQNSLRRWSYAYRYLLIVCE